MSEEFKTFFKKEPMIKHKRYGVYRKYSKPIKKPKPKKKKYAPPVYEGNPLLQPYYPKIAKVSHELYLKVMDRANGRCEICGRTDVPLTVHHVVGRKRKAHLNNLLALGDTCCHKPPNGVEGNPEKRYLTLHNYQQWCKKAGFTEEETRFLLNGKLVDDWDTDERIK